MKDFLFTMKRFKLSPSFFLFLFLILFSPKQTILFKLFLCLFLHECGHLFFIWIFRYRVEEIKLSIFGFFLKLDKVKEECYKDVFVFLGGILANILLLVIFYRDVEIFKLCLLLILFNSLPIYPLDGYNVLKSLFSYFSPYYFVLKIGSILGFVMSGAMLLGVIYLKLDLFLIFSALYIFIINFKRIFQSEQLFQQFLLDKMLYRFPYPLKEIALHKHYLRYLYKYHQVYILIGNVKLFEKELLEKRQLS